MYVSFSTEADWTISHRLNVKVSRRLLQTSDSSSHSKKPTNPVIVNDRKAYMILERSNLKDYRLHFIVEPNDEEKQIHVNWTVYVTWLTAAGQSEKFTSHQSATFVNENSNSINSNCYSNTDKIVPTPERHSILNICIDINSIQVIKNMSRKRKRAYDVPSIETNP